jgi:pimeloyl-ACP methyl ester carboxylesterase
MSQKHIKIESSIGKEIAAVVEHSKNKSNKLAILCPGFLDSKDYAGLSELAKELTLLGYDVIRFDPIGTWESEGSMQDYCPSQYLEDIHCVKEHMLAQAKYEHILLGGHSMGGRMALLYAPTDKAISIVIGIMCGYKKSFSGSEEWKKTGVQVNLRDLPHNKNEKRQYNVPYSFLEDSSPYNALDTIKQLTIPIMLIAGEEDTVCLPDVTRTIFEEANEPKQFVLLPGIGHDYRHNPAEIKQVNSAIINAIKSMRG